MILFWAKKVSLFFLGIFIMSFGVNFSVLSGLGVSPISSIPYTFSLVFAFDYGMMTAIIYCIYVLIQIIILKKVYFRHFLQIAASQAFGYFITLGRIILSPIVPLPATYLTQLFYMFISVILIAIGIFTYMNANIVSLPADGLISIISTKLGRNFSSAKLIFDCSSVFLSTVLSLIIFSSLKSVREGTIIAAVFVGLIMKIIEKIYDNFSKKTDVSKNSKNI